MSPSPRRVAIVATTCQRPSRFSSVCTARRWLDQGLPLASLPEKTVRWVMVALVLVQWML